MRHGNDRLSVVDEPPGQLVMVVYVRKVFFIAHPARAPKALVFGFRRDCKGYDRRYKRKTMEEISKTEKKQYKTGMTKTQTRDDSRETCLM